MSVQTCTMQARCEPQYILFPIAWSACKLRDLILAIAVNEAALFRRRHFAHMSCAVEKSEALKALLLHPSPLDVYISKRLQAMTGSDLVSELETWGFRLSYRPVYHMVGVEGRLKEFVLKVIQK